MKQIELKLDEEELLLPEDEQEELKIKKYHMASRFFDENFVIDKICRCSEEQKIKIEHLKVDRPSMLVLSWNNDDENGNSTVSYVFCDESGYYQHEKMDSLTDAYSVHEIVYLKFQQGSTETIRNEYQRRIKEAIESNGYYCTKRRLKRYVIPFEAECEKMNRLDLMSPCARHMFYRQRAYDKKQHIRDLGNKSFAREDNVLVKNLTLFGPAFIFYYNKEKERAFTMYADENGYYCINNEDDAIVTKIYYMEYIDKYDISNAPNGHVLKKIADDISPQRFSNYSGKDK